MEPRRFQAGERIAFPKEVTDGVRTFAQPHDTGTVLKFWPHWNIYSVINDVERADGWQRFDVDYWLVEQEGDENGNKTAF